MKPPTKRLYARLRKQGYTAKDSLACAKAHEWADDMEIQFEWDRDTDSCLSDFEDLPEGATDWYGWWCRAVDPVTGESTSLCGIHFADGEADYDCDSYHMIVQGELADELRYILENNYVEA